MVVFTIAIAAASTGTFLLGPIALEFGRLAGGGIAVGLIIGAGMSFLASRVDDIRVELSLTAVAAYGGYLLGEFVHVSGILVVVAAAIVNGNLGRPHGMSDRTQQAVDVFWDYVAFVLNTVTFVLIGLVVPWQQLLAEPGAIAAGALVALAARAAAVYLLLPPLRPLGLGGAAPLAALTGMGRPLRRRGHCLSPEPGGQRRRLRARARPGLRDRAYLDRPPGHHDRASGAGPALRGPNSVRGQPLMC